MNCGAIIGLKSLAKTCRRRRAFPIFAKLLDAQEKLSLQVHPDAVDGRLARRRDQDRDVVFRAADDGGEIYAGLRRGVDPGAT